VMAALELGRRVALAPAPDRRRLLRARDVAAVLWARLSHLPHEEFWTVLMNSRLQEILCVQIARGGLTQCSVSPREAFAPAIVHRAPAVAFIHNHPSGDSAPSAEDQRLQLLLDEAGHALGVRVIDHLVLAEGGVHSAVVVSPLVALMKDQVDALRARAIAATFVNSSLPESERQERQSALRRGEYRQVYVAPERFKSPSFLAAMGALKVPLLAVDEAHCI